MTTKLELLWNQVAELRQVVSVLSNSIDDLQKHVKMDDRALEKEITEKVKSHVLENYHGGKQLEDTTRVSRKVFNPDGSLITDLDGFLVTGDFSGREKREFHSEAARILTKPVYKDIESSYETLTSFEQFSQLKLTTLYIIEAKHHITKDKVEKKISQAKTIEHILDMIKSGEDISKTDAKFRKMCKSFKQFENAKVRLFIGGVWWDQNALELARLNKLGCVVLSGERYKIVDPLHPVAYLQNGGSWKER